MVSRLARDPRVGFVGLVLAAGAGLAAVGGLALERGVDSPSYLWQGRALAEALADFRTPGYPLLLALLRPLSPDYAALPALQFGLHAAAVALFAGALERFGASRLTAWASAAPLLFLSIAWSSARVLGPDSPAAAGAIVTLACLLRALARPGRSGPWLAVAAALLATCLLRPAYLFLAPLLPCLAALLAPLARGPASPRPHAAAGLALATTLPLLLYALLRLVVIGEFGIVAAGGTNAIGTTAWLLDDAVVARVPAAHRPLAAAILAERRRRQLYTPRTGEPLQLGALYRSYNVNVWQIAVPTAEALHGGPYAEHTPAINAAFAAIATSAIRERPRLYARLVTRIFLDGTLLTLANEPLLRPLLGAGLGLALLAAVRRRPMPGRDELRLPVAVSLLALAFFAAKLLLVALVETPEARYLAAAAVFLPAAGAAWCWTLARHAVGTAEAATQSA